MISALASECQGFKLRCLQFHIVKQLKKRAMSFWIQWIYYDQIGITSTSSHKNQIFQSWWEWQPSLFHSCSVYSIKQNFLNYFAHDWKQEWYWYNAGPRRGPALSIQIVNFLIEFFEALYCFLHFTEFPKKYPCQFQCKPFEMSTNLHYFIHKFNTSSFKIRVD